MAIGTNVPQKRTATTPTRTQQPQPSIMNRIFCWLQLSFFNVFRWFLPAREQLSPRSDPTQSSQGRIYDNAGPAVSVRQTGAVNAHTNISESEIRSFNSTAPIAALPPGVTRLYRNKGLALEADTVESINTTTSIGRPTNAP